MDERHRQAVMALSVMLHEAQGVLDVERGRDIDIGGEVVTVRAVLDEYRTALAAANERAEALKDERDRLQDDLTGWHDRALDAEARADALAARAEAGEALISELRATIANERFDAAALAARLREVEP